MPIVRVKVDPEVLEAICGERPPRPATASALESFMRRKHLWPDECSLLETDTLADAEGVENIVCRVLYPAGTEVPPGIEPPMQLIFETVGNYRRARLAPPPPLEPLPRHVQDRIDDLLTPDRRATEWRFAFLIAALGTIGLYAAIAGGTGWWSH